MIPGEFLLASGDIALNAGRETVRLRVDNTGDRPIQVGSHTHFFEVNRFLRFDRARAYGFRLDIPAGTALRFEPGEGREVELVALAGRRTVFGMNRLAEGPLDDADAGQRRRALDRARAFSTPDLSARGPREAPEGSAPGGAPPSARERGWGPASGE